MNYFILFYRIVLYGGKTYSGRAMNAVRESIFIESEIIPLIEAEYRLVYPGTGPIYISILKARQTTFKVYNAFYQSKKKLHVQNIALIMDNSLKNQDN